MALGIFAAAFWKEKFASVYQSTPVWYGPVWCFRPGSYHTAARIDQIRNYGPGTRDGASGWDRAAVTVASLASCSFVAEEFDR